MVIFLIYGITVDNTILATFGASPEQQKKNKKLMFKVLPVFYCTSTNSEMKMQYLASGMLFVIFSNV